MIDNLINEIEQAMLNVLDNEQLSQLRKVLDYTFRNVSVTKKESVHTESNNQTLLTISSLPRKLKVAQTSPSPITRALSSMLL